MKLKRMQQLIFTALFAAIVCIATFIKIPFPAQFGYYNLGDCFVMLSGFLLSPIYAAVAAGLGSALTDILSGYAQYAPATFIIKALMALAICIMSQKLIKKPLISKLLGYITAETILVLGYFGYESLILSYGIAAAGNIIPNLMQGITGIALSIIILMAIKKNKTLKSFFKR